MRCLAPVVSCGVESSHRHSKPGVSAEPRRSSHASIGMAFTLALSWSLVNSGSVHAFCAPPECWDIKDARRFNLDAALQVRRCSYRRRCSCGTGGRKRTCGRSAWSPTSSCQVRVASTSSHADAVFARCVNLRLQPHQQHHDGPWHDATGPPPLMLLSPLSVCTVRRCRQLRALWFWRSRRHRGRRVRPRAQDSAVHTTPFGDILNLPLRPRQGSCRSGAAPARTCRR